LSIGAVAEIADFPLSQQLQLLNLSCSPDAKSQGQLRLAGVMICNFNICFDDCFEKKDRFNIEIKGYY
jgi:hypothetical protein